MYLTGWLGYFRICSDTAENRRQLNAWDAHIRRRLRAIKLRQFKHKPTIVRRLIAMGAPEPATRAAVYGQARSIGRLSHTYAVEQGAMPPQWFAKQGLVSLVHHHRECWRPVTASAKKPKKLKAKAHAKQGTLLPPTWRTEEPDVRSTSPVLWEGSPGNRRPLPAGASPVAAWSPLRRRAQTPPNRTAHPPASAPPPVHPTTAQTTKCMSSLNRSERRPTSPAIRRTARAPSGKAKDAVPVRAPERNSRGPIPYRPTACATSRASSSRSEGTGTRTSCSAVTSAAVTS